MSFGSSAIGTLPYGDGTGGSSIVYYDVTLVSPTDASTASGFYPMFTSYPQSSDGSAMQIEWQWDTDSSFTNSLGTGQAKTTTGNLSATNATATPNAALHNGPYYWRVRAGNGTSWSNYTSGWSLNVPFIALLASAYAYQNVGTPLVASKDATGTSYENIGLAPGTPRTVIRPPQGWGTIPSGPQTVNMLLESSAGTAEAYENIQ